MELQTGRMSPEPGLISAWAYWKDVWDQGLTVHFCQSYTNSKETIWTGDIKAKEFKKEDRTLNTEPPRQTHCL